MPFQVTEETTPAEHASGLRRFRIGEDEFTSIHVQVMKSADYSIPGDPPTLELCRDVPSNQEVAIALLQASARLVNTVGDSL